MDQKFDEDNLKKAINEINIESSKEWRDNTLDSLKLLSKHGEIASFEEKSSPAGGQFSLSAFLFSNFFTMKKVFALVVVIALAGLGYYQFFYTAVEDLSPVEQVHLHLDNASEALAQIEAYTQGEGLQASETGNLFIPAAYADEDEGEQLEDLLEEVADETDEAIEAAEEIEDAEDAVEVLGEIDELQDETVDVLSDLIEMVEDEELTEAVLEVIEDTVEENEELEDVQDQVEEAVFKGKAEGKGKGKALGHIKFKFNVLTDIDEEEAEAVDEDEDLDEEDVDLDEDEDLDEEEEEDEEFGFGYVQEQIKKQEQIQVRLEQSEELLSNVEAGVEAEEIELTPRMQEKFETVQEIIETCAAGEGDCNSGKAKGLSTALDAKVKNVIRKQEKEEFKYGYDGTAGNGGTAGNSGKAPSGQVKGKK